jgi:hypothetical protein
MTIRVGAPRRRGKTEAMKRLISEEGMNAIVVYPSSGMADIGPEGISFGPDNLGYSDERIEAEFVGEAEFFKPEDMAENGLSSFVHV